MFDRRELPYFGGTGLQFSPRARQPVVPAAGTCPGRGTGESDDLVPDGGLDQIADV